MSTYNVTVTFEVTGPPGHKRAVEKLMHGLVQALVTITMPLAKGQLLVTGASADDVTEYR